MVLLLTVIAPALLFTGFFVKQKNIQHKMNERLQKAPLHTITANIADVKWIKKNKEVEVYGRMFDIKKFHISGNQIILTGLYDDDEYQLKKDLAELMKEKKDGAAPLNQLVLKFIFTQAIVKTDTFIAPINNTAYKFNYVTYSERAHSQYMAVFTPPPLIV